MIAAEAVKLVERSHLANGIVALIPIPLFADYFVFPPDAFTTRQAIPC